MGDPEKNCEGAGEFLGFKSRGLKPADSFDSKRDAKAPLFHSRRTRSGVHALLTALSFLACGGGKFSEAGDGQVGLGLGSFDGTDTGAR